MPASATAQCSRQAVGTAPNGGSIDIVDTTGMQALGEALQNDRMSTYTDQTHTP